MQMILFYGGWVYWTLVAITVLLISTELFICSIMVIVLSIVLNEVLWGNRVLNWCWWRFSFLGVSGRKVLTVGEYWWMAVSTGMPTGGANALLLFWYYIVFCSICVVLYRSIEYLWFFVWESVRGGGIHEFSQGISLTQYHFLLNVWTVFLPVKPQINKMNGVLGNDSAL